MPAAMCEVVALFGGASGLGNEPLSLGRGEHRETAGRQTNSVLFGGI